MKVIFAGTPEFASAALRQLLAAGYRVPLVLTQPDRPAGRGLKLQASAVKQLALQHGITVAQPRSLRLDGKYQGDAAAAHAAMLAAQADVMVVAAYGLILPQWVLDLPRLGCLNIHASLLPRWRGAAPIHRAIEAGDARTGITIMQMDAGLDTGDMLQVASLPIADDDTTTTLQDKLAALGGQCIVQALQALQGGPTQPSLQPSLQPIPQPSLQPIAQPRLPQGTAPDSDAAHQLGITYAHKIDKAEALINWQLSAEAIARKVRALDPFPGCTALIAGETVKINAAVAQADLQADPPAVMPPTAHPVFIGDCYENNSNISNKHLDYGTILYLKPDSIGVQCGDGVLQLTQLQRAGGKRLPVADFLRGFALQVGQRFE
jgi:methionyl-tRNA formyltransferase